MKPPRFNFVKIARKSYRVLEAEVDHISKKQKNQKSLTRGDRQFMRQMLNSSLLWLKRQQSTRLGNRKAVDAPPEREDLPGQASEDELSRLEAFAASGNGFKIPSQGFDTESMSALSRAGR